MSELKAYIAPTADGTGLADYYLKSEADRVISELIEKNKRLASKDKIMASETIKDLLKELRHHKYKRCLAMARMCEERSARYDVLQERHDLDWGREIEFYYRWYKRWLELADKFKEGV